MTPATNFYKTLAWTLSAIFLCAANPASSKDGIEISGDLSVRAVQAERGVFQGEDVESSGAGARAEAGFEWTRGKTEIQFDLSATVFDFSDENRETRESASAGLTIAHSVSDTVTLAVYARRSENIVTLESRSADQTSAGAEFQYEDDDNRIRLRAEYRTRDYDGTTTSSGSGMRFDAQYNRRFGSWHWARIDLRAEDIDSDNPRRGYERYTAKFSYSLPIAKRLRLRPEISMRAWEYDNRAVPDGQNDILRKDSMVAPEIGLAYGKLTGFYGRARASYEFRSSNDPRYREDAPRFELSIGYRF
ncbi:hypothetical protein GCM10023115_04340 [Pontixanthobacter gangjinensis]|uniref:DUF481 domain-containing protein n=1 Tax=Pontixanthobacter gangjinensis TaxID=1028742 RepID=A0A6I4SJS7_9SPHN|nr:hypothetical protein [Pontixanthobacter gangjinensis]MXO55688.1 hypothetical protein [Pontixanthobacter gangjinensis]